MELDVFSHFKLSTKEVAKLLGVHHQTIYRWRAMGYGPKSVKFGNQRRYSHDEVLEWMMKNNEWLADFQMKKV